MDLALLFIIVLQFAYIVYKDVSFSKERDKLAIKSLSKDVDEYVSAVKSIEPDEKVKAVAEDTYISVEDLSVDEVLKAKDNT